MSRKNNKKEKKAWAIFMCFMLCILMTTICMIAVHTITILLRVYVYLNCRLVAINRDGQNTAVWLCYKCEVSDTSRISDYNSRMANRI